MTEYQSLFISAPDGLSLHARDYGAPTAAALPVVCLPGLARHSADFHDLALALANDPVTPRRVLALDYRGRGRSERDPNPRNYDIRVEMNDVLATLAAAGVAEAVFVGTSRGGLIAMALSAARPAAIRGVVLNDVGPVIDGKGLVRIRGYVGKLPQPRDFKEAAKILRKLSDHQFPRLDEASWEAMARATWEERDGRLVPAYDPMLTKTLESIDLEAPLPQLWHLFEGLKRVPVLALRGANSDLLSAETLAAMAARHPDCETMTVPDQGHAPILKGNLVARVADFVARVENPARALRAKAA